MFRKSDLKKRKSQFCRKEKVLESMIDGAFGGKKLSCIIVDSDGVPLAYAPIMDVPTRVIRKKGEVTIHLDFTIQLTEV